MKNVFWLNLILIFNISPNSLSKVWLTTQKKYESLMDSLSHINIKPYHIEGWNRMRDIIKKNIIYNKPDLNFLSSYDISVSMVRQGFGYTQSIEEGYLNSYTNKTIQQFMQKFSEENNNILTKTSKLFNCSSNSLGHLFYVSRIIENFGEPKNLIVELGGGYGSLAKICNQLFDNCTYAILDIPESIALQYLFLKINCPKTKIKIHKHIPTEFKPNSINLIPIYFCESLNIKCDLFVSNFALDETPQLVQDLIYRKRFFNANSCYITGNILLSINIFELLKNIYNKNIANPIHLGHAIEIISSCK